MTMAMAMPLAMPLPLAMPMASNLAFALFLLHCYIFIIIYYIKKIIFLLE